MEKQLVKRIRRLSKNRGVTLVEVLIVLAIMALIAGMTAFVGFPYFKKAQIDATVQSAKAIKKAAQLYVQLGDGQGCPTVQDLVNAKSLDKGTTDDTWGTPFKIECKEGDEINVISAGRDKKEPSPDDIRDDFKKADVERVTKL